MAGVHPSVRILIPALDPDERLLELVQALLDAPYVEIVVVDDGSDPKSKPYFDAIRKHPRVTYLQHAVNLGKGAALKTGINHIICTASSAPGVITVDGDGQHHPEDVLAVAEALQKRPEALILGVRAFQGPVPWRSRVGNAVTNRIARALIGVSFADTQTGLRGIPALLLPDLLRIPSMRYEFELDMLIAARHRACPLAEVPVRTIYLDQNRSSHFNPLLDSMRVYLVLFRFGVVSLITAAIDNLAFYISFRWTGSIATSQLLGRSIAILFNYTAARRAVFLSREKNSVTLPRYLLVVLFNALVSYSLILLLTTRLHWGVIWSKVIAETTLFLANFVIQRDLVFTKRRAGQVGGATDWTRYYDAVPPTARVTRRYTTSVLLDRLRKIAVIRPNPSIIEIGGANSCFLSRILKEIQPVHYSVVDNNEHGLALLQNRLAANAPVGIFHRNVLALSLDMQADVVFSVGLIEHFHPEETRRAILAHLDCLKSGGHLILSFPTPTWLYRIARCIAETLGVWRFPDERPLHRAEVAQTIQGRGTIIFEKTLWPLVFTQHMLVVQKP